MSPVDIYIHRRKAVGETFRDETLGREVITLIKIVLADDVIDARITLERSRMKYQTIDDVGKPTKACVRSFERNPAYESMDFVPQAQKIFGEITPVLTGYTGDEGFLCHRVAWPQ
jgi:hypothetical protein